MSPCVEERQELPDHRRVVALLRVADMHHEPRAALARRPPRQLRHLHAHDLEGGRDHARLDARDEALVLVEHLQRVAQIDAALRDDVGHRGEPCLADVEEGDDLGMAARHDVPGKRAEGRRARAPRVDDGRHPGEDTAEIGIDAGAVDALEHMGVQVDQAGRDDLATHRDGAGRLRRRDVRRDARDLPALDRNVVHPVEPRGWIHHGAALEQEIVHGLASWVRIAIPRAS